MFHFLFGTHSICFLFSFSSSSKPFPLCLLCNSLNSLCHCPHTLSPSRLLLTAIGIVSAKPLSPITPCALSVSSTWPLHFVTTHHVVVSLILSISHLVAVWFPSFVANSEILQAVYNTLLFGSIFLCYSHEEIAFLC